MDIETKPHAMYFTGNTDTDTKINHIPYQTIVYNENGMFTTKLMNDTPVEYLLTMELHLPFSHYILIINYLFYIHTPRQKVCYTPLNDKCDAIRNLEPPKTLRQTRAFCGMVISYHYFYLIFEGY